MICCNTRWSLIANVCAKLHNLCIDRNVPEAPRYLHDVIYLNGFHDEDPNVPVVAHGQTTESRRKTMTDQLQAMTNKYFK